MFFQTYFEMYPEMPLFIASGAIVAISLILIAYLIATRKRGRIYARVLRQETELFDALTTTAALTQTRALSDFDSGTNLLEAQTGVFNPKVIAHAYSIEYEVGSGAMSRTFVVRSKKLGNLWFLKFISGRDGRLANEEHILKLLNHPGLPRIVDVFHRDEGTYLIVTLVEGISLTNLGETGLSINQITLMDWLEQIAQALNYLHNIKPAPVFHLDLKPGNVMVTHDNRLVLVDFGISRRFGEEAAGAVTAVYAAPEQFGGRVPAKYAEIIRERFGALPPEFAQWQIDARTDIYGLGAIMFELATGRLPTMANLKILENFVSREIAAIIQKCLSVNPAGRYHSAAELLEALRKLKGTKIAMARTLIFRRIASIAAIVAMLAAGGTLLLGFNVLAFENGARITSRPDIITVSLGQSAAFAVARHLPDDRIIQLDSTQIIWDAEGGNIAHIDGGRVTGINPGETRITGRHRDSAVSLDVRVVQPMRDIIQISQRYELGRTISIFAGDYAIRSRVDGPPAAINFFSPESIAAAATAHGDLYIADAGVIRRISGGASQTIAIDPAFIAVDMLRHSPSGLFILTAPWQEADGNLVFAIGSVTNGSFQAIYTADAARTAVEDFAIGGERLYFILRNDGLGAIFLKSVGLQNTDDIITHTALPGGATSLAIADDGVIFIGNTATGHIQAYIDGILRNFAGADDRSFIDGTSPRFYMPQRLEYRAGYLYIWDFNTLRRVAADRGVAGEAVTIAGMAAPIYEQHPGGAAFAAHDIILPHGRLMDFAVTADGIFITDHKRGLIWRVDY